MTCRSTVPKLRLGLAFLSTALSVGAGLAGCSSNSSSDRKKTVLPPSRYDTRPPKEVPAFMKGTIYEVADIEERQPYMVSGFGLVAGLEGTGNNNRTPMAVRQYMQDEMNRHGFGSDIRGLKHLPPETVLRSGQAAIVEVYGFIPPGARAGQRMDVLVRAAEGSETTSLARGSLFRTSLFINGVDYINPRGKVNVYGRAEGPLFVNPVYMNSRSSSTRPSGTSANLRNGTIMDGGYVVEDRPLYVRVRAPQLSVARAIELRIHHQFQDTSAARTKDEGIVFAFVPRQYDGDSEHFLGVLTHLYLDTTPGSGALRARMLAEEAAKSDAKLLDISYCWEGLGKEAIPAVQPLYTHHGPDVAYAAARAGAFVGDYAAEEALADMARADAHPFQLNAVQTLGQLTPSTRIDRVLADVLTSKNTLARIAAYDVLAAHESPVILSKQVGHFTIDRVLCEGEPLVYATRTGRPRIGIFGKTVSIRTPIMFRTLEDRFTISTGVDAGTLTMFDRTSDPAGVTVRTRPDVMEIIYRLGGGTEDRLRFGYADIVGILQGLNDGRHLAANFVLQDLPGLQESIEDAPPIIEPAGPPAAGVGAAAGSLSAANVEK
jgi:hypothetical protein